MNNPIARKNPPKNSDIAAAQAKTLGRGNPMFPVRSTKAADGGSFPTPCAIINETPAKTRKTLKPALANGDNPDSPPKSIFLSIYSFFKYGFYFAVKEWHNLRAKTTNQGRPKRVFFDPGAGRPEVPIMGEIDIANLLSHLVIFIVVLLLAISSHEAGHAWMSYKYGDDTAYMLGRVTLNPVKHTDPIGTLLIPILGFVFGAFGGALASIPLLGWGIPTPVNPRKWTNYKVANVMVSIAGIGANLIIAVVSFLIFKLLLETGTINAGNVDSGIIRPIVILFQYLIMLNVSLAIFNLLPFPPLDGSKVLSTFLPDSFQPVFALLEQYGFLILLLLIYWGLIGLIMRPVFRLVEYLLFVPWF